MKNILLLLSCCLFLIACDSCKKSADTPIAPVDQLPDPHTSSSRSVFACLVNGEVWKPSFGINNPGYTYHEPTGGLNIGGSKNTIDNDNTTVNTVEIAFGVNFQDTGVFELRSIGYFDSKYCLDYPIYELDTLSSYQTEIEYFSKEEGVIIGTFEFTAINNDCPGKSDTVRITDGRFKATYK
jgi:hypothetical protein